MCFLLAPGCGDGVCVYKVGIKTIIFYLYTNICRVYMEAVKLETLHGSTPVISNLQVAQDSLGSGTVISTCAGSQLLVRSMEQ